MGKTMSDETKAKIAAARSAKKAEEAIAGVSAKRATIDEQIAALQAQADGGDGGAAQLLPVIETYREKLAQAKQDAKSAARRLRKLLAI